MATPHADAESQPQKAMAPGTESTGAIKSLLKKDSIVQPRPIAGHAAVVDTLNLLGTYTALLIVASVLVVGALSARAELVTWWRARTSIAEYTDAYIPEIVDVAAIDAALPQFGDHR